MPVGKIKNCIYQAVLPIMGRRCRWSGVECDQQPKKDCSKALAKILKRHYVVGAAIQVVRGGTLAECYKAGYKRLFPDLLPVQFDTVFRSASIAKFATALLVFRLQSLGKLNVTEDISDFLGYTVRNPLYPDTPIRLGMLLSHTSSIIDSSMYYTSFTNCIPLCNLFISNNAFSRFSPGDRFHYSNLAAGMIGSLLESRFNAPFESIAQEYLLKPLNVRGTFDITTMDMALPSDSYRVIPRTQNAAFNAVHKQSCSVPLTAPDPEHHYRIASGSFFVSANEMGKLLLLIPGVRQTNGVPFLSKQSLAQLKTPQGKWPLQTVHMQHGMGLLMLNVRPFYPQTLYGHQGYAYGAVNGCFITDNGDGFVSLNNGASETRQGHLSLLNRDLIDLFCHCS